MTKPVAPKGFSLNFEAEQIEVYKDETLANGTVAGTLVGTVTPAIGYGTLRAHARAESGRRDSFTTAQAAIDFIVKGN